MTIKFIDKSEFILGGGDWELAPFKFSKILKLGGGTSPSYEDIVLSGNGSVTLTNAKADGLNYVKLFGGSTQGNVPSGYTQVTSISVPSGAYFITDIYPTNNTEFELDFQKASSVNSRIFGANNYAGGTTSNSFTIQAFDGYKVYYQYSSMASLALFTSTVSDTTKRHRIKIAEGKIYIDGVLAVTPSAQDAFTCTNPLIIGGGYNAGSATGGFSGKIYGGTNIIPCKRNSDNKVGLYNTSTNTFYSASGSGTVTIGDNAPIPDNPLNIISNNGVVKFGENVLNGLNLGQGTYISTSATRIWQEFGKLNGKYKITVTGNFEFIVQYRNTPKSGSTPTVFGNIDTWTTSGEYVLDNSDYYYGIAIRYSDNAEITPSDFDGTISLQPLFIHTDGTVETVEDSLNNTATAEMLLALGTYKDVHSVLDGAITRNIGILILDGSEDWEISGSGNSMRAVIKDDIGLANTYQTTLPNLVCTHYAFGGYYSTGGSTTVGTFNAWADRTSSDAPAMYLRFSTVSIGGTTKTTVSAWTAWLADQYNAGTPVTIIYPLATATTDTVTGQPLTVQAGTNIIEITQASIDNLPLEVSYKGTV